MALASGMTGDQDTDDDMKFSHSLPHPFLGFTSVFTAAGGFSSHDGGTGHGQRWC